jgi:hypothetical protein
MGPSWKAEVHRVVGIICVCTTGRQQAGRGGMHMSGSMLQRMLSPPLWVTASTVAVLRGSHWYACSSAAWQGDGAVTCDRHEG